MKSLRRLVKFLLVLYFISINNAFAYLDPGTGSIILQAILAVIASISAAATFYWRKIKMKIKNFFTKKNKTNNSENKKNY